MKKEEITEEKIGYRQIFTQKEYCKIIAANIINRFGDSIDSVAFTWMVYAITGSASWSAIIYTLNLLPSILLQPFAGAVVERRNKKKLMVLSDILRGIVVVTLAAIYITGNTNPLALAVFTLTISTVEAFCFPASSAIVPKVLEKKYYTFGTSLNAVASRVAELIGMGAAGIIIGVWGVGTAIFIDAVTFFLSALIKMCLRVEETVLREQGNGGVTQYFKDLREGFAYIRGKAVIVNLCLLGFLVNAMLVPLNAFQSPLVVDVLGQGSELLSVIGVALVIGMIVGGVCFPYLAERISANTLIYGNGVGLAAAFGAITLGSHFTGNVPAVYASTAVAAFAIGFFIDLLSSVASVQFMKNVSEDYMARASAMFGSGAAAAMPLTSVFMSVLVRYVPVKQIIIACSLICAIIFIAASLLKVQMEGIDERECQDLQ